MDDRQIERQETASAAGAEPHANAEVSIEDARRALKNGPRGALVVASISLALLILGWLAFYFLLFLPRGEIN